MRMEGEPRRVWWSWRKRRQARKLVFEVEVELHQQVFRERRMSGGMAESHWVREATKRAAASAEIADKGVFLDVVWLEPDVAEVLHALDSLLADLVVGRSLVDARVVADRVLDIRNMLTRRNDGAEDEVPTLG